MPHSGIDPGNLPPAADFTYGVYDLTVTFDDFSSDPDPDGSITAWEWDLGDGTITTTQHPTHTYAAGGSYNVTLTATDNEGASDAISQQVTLSGGNQSPTADFSYISSGLVVTFTNTSHDPDGSLAAWNWNFGDGNSSLAYDPVFTYTIPGTYDVLLTVTDDQGASDTLGQQVTVSDGGGAVEMCIGGLTGAAVSESGGRWNATVTILVLDESGDPVVNANLGGSWSKGFYASSNCTTDASGQCAVEQTGIDNKTRWASFTIDDVTHLTLTYNAAQNVMSALRVDRP